MRTKLDFEIKSAMKAQNKDRLSTLRLINAAIKDRDISVRSEENSQGVSDETIVDILTQMIKQRNDSITHYEEAGRLELSERENNEIFVIREFLPKQLSDDEISTAIERVIAEEKATSIRDMGKVIGLLKREYNGKVDFSKIGPLVKKLLLN